MHTASDHGQHLSGLAAGPGKRPYIHRRTARWQRGRWRITKWRKRAMWPTQRRALTQANCFHVTSEKELDDVRRLGFSNRVAIIHNGIDLPALGQHIKNPAAPRRLLFLGRVHRLKPLDRLLESWKLLQAKFPDWELTIAGEDDGAISPN